MMLNLSHGPLQLVVGVDDVSAGGGQLQFGIQTQAVGIEQVGEDGQLVQVTVAHNAVVLFGLADGKA